MVYDLIFNPQKRKATLDDLHGNESSIVNYKNKFFNNNNYFLIDDTNQYQIQVPHKIIRPSLSPPTLTGDLDLPEPLYEGSRSLYTRSPVLTRANLSRSQSLYHSKSTHNLPHNLPPRDYLPRPGPLLPAQSLYPLTTTTTTVCTDRTDRPDRQNQQNQQRQYEPTYSGRNSSTVNASGNHNGE